MIDPKDLHALADGELSNKEAASLREALKADPRAAAEVDAILNLKDVLRESSIRHENEEAWRACVGRLNELDKSRRVEGFVGRYAWVLCGLMFAFIVSGRFAMHEVQGDSVETPEFARILPTSNRSTVLNAQQSREADRVLKALKGSLDPKEIQISPPTIGTVHGNPTVLVFLRDRVGDMSLAEVEGTLNPQDTMPLSGHPDMGVSVANGRTCLVWHAGGHTYLLSGDREVESLQSVAQQLFGLK